MMRRLELKRCKDLDDLRLLIFTIRTSNGDKKLSRPQDLFQLPTDHKEYKPDLQRAQKALELYKKLNANTE